MAQYKSSPVGYRHTINHENSSQVQNNLKAMLGQQPKHQTLDMGGQSAAIHHLRMQGLDQQGRRQQDNNLQNSQNSAYEGADSLRNQANKMFARNGGERSSVGYSQGPGQPVGHSGGGHQGQGGQGGGHPPPVTYPAHFPNSPHNQSQHSLNQSMEKTGTPGQGRARTNSMEEAAKRNSYGNQSFRTAVQQQQPGGGGGPGGPGGPGAPPRQGRQPPAVPPKPGSRSASKERPRDSTTEENEYLETELNNILRGQNNNNNNNNQLGFEKTNGSAGTPPLPALSPGQSANQTPQSSPDFRQKYKLNDKLNNSGEYKGINGDYKQTNNRPDLLDTGGARSGEGRRNNENQNIKERMKELKSSVGLGGKPGDGGEEVASTTTGLDLESVMALQTDLTSDEEQSTTIDLSDAQAIRKQLDGLENMYTEVLKLLGLRKFGRPGPERPGDVKGGIARRKMYGSMSSLPSVSSIGSRHLYGKDKRKDDRKNRTGSKDKNYAKRFQRLESHVVTLARSVAHLSSEMRTQHVIVQEIEALRAEVAGIRAGPGGRGHTGSLPRGGVLEPQEFLQQGYNHPRVSQQTENRVKKLTKFFGDEPPLLRLYLKNLGYEKYAGIFEEAKIGMLELPYLSEERLEKLGIPLGPRIRILQEAKIPYNLDGQNYNVYIL